MVLAQDESISAGYGSFPVPRSRADGSLQLNHHQQQQQQQQQQLLSMFLPSTTAPVSSLLPHIPAGAAHCAFVAPAIQAQLAALLTQGAVAQQQRYHLSSSASSGSSSIGFAQQAAAAAAHPAATLLAHATGSSGVNPLSTSSENMQHWSLSQIGTWNGAGCYLLVQC